MIVILLLCAGAIALVWYIREKVRAYSLKTVFIKALVSMLFVALGVYGAFRSAGAARGVLCPFVLLGLVCGLMGDIWLDLKYVFPERDEPFTYAGFCAFGVGHLFGGLRGVAAFGIIHGKRKQANGGRAESCEQS